MTTSNPALPSSSLPSARRVIVLQDGARLHYAIPLAIQRTGILDRVYTNWYSRPGSVDSLLSKIVGWHDHATSRKMLDRYCPELDPSKITAFRSMVWHERRGLGKFPSMIAYFAWLSDLFAQRVRKQGWGNANTLFGFVRSIHPGLCRDAQRDGLTTIADQMIAPYAIEVAEEELQNSRFPGWSSEKSSEIDRLLIDFETRTWAHLDHITCASPYVRDGLVAQGIAADRISVLPYPLNVAEFPLHDRSNRRGEPVTVGFVGAVGLRKGVPYFSQVAKRLKGKGIRFVLVGPVKLAGARLAEVKENVEVVGSVPRSEVIDWLRRFDILLFPTTCEGSAGSVMEAMATGLPVVTSPNAGSLVENGKSGFIAAYDDVERLAGAVETLASDAAKRAEMGCAGRVAVEACTINSYSRKWIDMMQSLPVVGEGRR